MFEFTKGKEIEELENLLKHKRIDSVYLAGFISPVKCRYIEGKFFHSSYDRYSVSSIIWDSTRTLVEDKKEEKVEKIEVRGWSDVQGYVICKDVDMVVEKQQRRSYGGSVFKVDSLEKCVKILNALGGNFEYKEIEVIDTLEKWEEFQERICRFSYVYDRVLGVFIEMRSDNDNESFVDIIDGDVTVKKIEEKYNVDLKILKVAR